MPRATVTENKRLVQSVYDAIHRSDTGAVLGLLDQDIVLQEADSLPFGGTYKGIEAVSQAIGKVMETLDLANLTVAEIVAEGDRVVAFLEIPIHGREGADKPTIPVAETWRLRDRKVIEICPYYYDSQLLWQ